MLESKLAAVEAARAAVPDAKTRALIALVSRTIAAVRPYAESAGSCRSSTGPFEDADRFRCGTKWR